jgi:hypothetical protein
LLAFAIVEEFACREYEHAGVERSTPRLMDLILELFGLMYRRIDTGSRGGESLNPVKHPIVLADSSTTRKRAGMRVKAYPEDPEKWCPKEPS